MLRPSMAARVHPSSVVSDKAELGDGTQIWLYCQVRENVRIGKGCVLGKGIYIDTGVTIGDNVKIQNNASIYTGVTIEDGVFVGPHVCFTNDKVPRAVNPDMSLKGLDDWHVTPTLVKAGAALGANSTIVCGVTVGRWAMVASGTVVTKDVPDHALVMGNPARFFAWVCSCGKRVQIDESERRGVCACGRTLLMERSADGRNDVVRVA
ncbi:MAG TPA: acyltransferase [Labilithrix sp.]|nr:acyltransferase [Labilithrix sp.]